MNRMSGMRQLWKQSGKWFRHQSTQKRLVLHETSSHEEPFPPKPEFNWAYLTDPENVKIIEKNIESRKGIGNPQFVVCTH